MRLLFLLLFLALSSPAFAADWFIATVASGGSDSNSGAIGSPFATMDKACSMEAAGDTIYFRTGSYAQRIDNCLTNGTSAAARTTVSNYNGESVTITCQSGGTSNMMELSGKSHIQLVGTGYSYTPGSFTGTWPFVFDGNHTCQGGFDWDQDVSPFVNVGLRMIGVELREIVNSCGVFQGNQLYFAFNHLDDCGTVGTGNDDHGFYYYGANSIFENNFIENIVVGYGIQQYIGSLFAANDNIYRNIVCTNNDAACILIADGRRAQIINLVSRADGTDPAYGHGSIRLYFTSRDTEIYNATIIGAGEDSGDGCIVVETAATGTAKNNILHDCFGGVDISYRSQPTPLTTGNNSTADPLVASEAGGDWSLSAGSPCREGGTNLTSEGVTTDIVGTARPQETLFDCGAFEYIDPPASDPGAITITEPLSTFEYTRPNNATVTLGWSTEGLSGNVDLWYTVGDGPCHAIATVAFDASPYFFDAHAAAVPATTNLEFWVTQDASNCAGSVVAQSGTTTMTGEYLP